jgi:hypothetical protein
MRDTEADEERHRGRRGEADEENPPQRTYLDKKTIHNEPRRQAHQEKQQPQHKWAPDPRCKTAQARPFTQHSMGVAVRTQHDVPFRRVRLGGSVACHTFMNGHHAVALRFVRVRVVRVRVRGCGCVAVWFPALCLFVLVSCVGVWVCGGAVVR